MVLHIIFVLTQFISARSQLQSRPKLARTKEMVFVKKICPSERRKAIIAVKAIPSHPTLSIRKSNEDSRNSPFQLRISLSIVESKQPGKAITICTNGSVFEPSAPEGELDTLAKKTCGLISTSDSSRRINLGQFNTHSGRPEKPPSPDLKERASTHLLIIPADGAIEVIHDLPVDRIFKFEDVLTPSDVEGERWRLKLNDGHIGTSWWCWGGLDDDLKGKKLSAWHEGMRPEIMPRPEVDDGWVLGCNPMELVFEDRTEDACFRFVA